MHLFSKKKFKKLPEQREWDHEINLLKNVSKKLNTEVYTITVKENKI